MLAVVVVVVVVVVLVVVAAGWVRGAPWSSQGQPAVV